MKRKISTLLYLLSVVIGTINVQAQKITYIGENLTNGSAYYMQNVGTGYFLKSTTEMVDKYSAATTFTTNSGKNSLSISNLSYNNPSKGAWTLNSTATNNWMPHMVNDAIVLYSVNNAIYWTLEASNTNIPTLTNETSVVTETPNAQWKFVSSEQAQVFDTDLISASLKAKNYGNNIKAEWLSNISTKKEGTEWGAYYSKISGDCMNLRITGLKAGKYAVDFYGRTGMSKSTSAASATVKCRVDDYYTSSCSKKLSKNTSHYIIPIEITEDAAMDILIDAGATSQEIWAVVKNIKAISDVDYYALMTTWTPETPTTGDYYIYNAEALSYLKAKGTAAKTDRNIQTATQFNIYGNSNSYITYNNDSYFVTDGSWTTNKNQACKWDIALQSSLGSNAFSITKNGATNILKCDDENSISYPAEDPTVKSVWNFISKEQFYAVYPQDRIRTMLSKDDIEVNHKINSPLATSYNSNKAIWVSTETNVGQNNVFNISNLANDKYIVEVYASKGYTDNVATVEVNGQSQPITSSLESYTFTVDVTDGKIDIKEVADNGALTLSLAIKEIVPASIYNNVFMKVLKGETLQDKVSYYINNVGGSSYLTGYGSGKSVSDISDAITFAFTKDGNGYKIANGTNILGFKRKQSGATVTVNFSDDYSAWSMSIPLSSPSVNGNYYQIYTIQDKDWKDKYFYWNNNNGDIVSLDEQSKSGDYGTNYYFRFISDAQYNALFPQNQIRTSLKNENIEVLRESMSNLEMYSNNGQWLVKQPVSRPGNYSKIVINNLKDDIYIVEIAGLFDSSTPDMGDAKIWAQVGSQTIDFANLSNSLETYTYNVPVTDGKLILYVEAYSDVSAIYTAIKSIVSYSELNNEKNNAIITWTNETPAKGDFIIYHPNTKTFLNTPGKDGSVLNGSDFKLFHLENGSSSSISYNVNGTTQYVCHKTGDGDWGTSPMTWTIKKNGSGYNIHNDNRYIQYNDEYKLRYPHDGTGVGHSKSSTYSNYGSDREWYFITEDQYNSVAPAAIAKKYASLGTGVTATWKTAISTTHDYAGRWMAQASVNKDGKYNYIKLTGLTPGYYDVQMYAGSTNGNNEVLYAISKDTVSRKLGHQVYHYFSLPVNVISDSLVIYIDAKANWQNVVSVIKDIKPITVDKGVVDGYITNPYFARPQGRRHWDYGWTVNSFEPSASTENGGFENSAIYPELTGIMNQHGETASISQKVKLAPGVYDLSADVLCIGRYGFLYAKVNNSTQHEVFCSGQNLNNTLEFNISKDTYPEGTEVEIGFYSTNGGYSDPTSNTYYGVDGTNQFYVGVDNFRLSYIDDFLKNADFSEGATNWTVSGDFRYAETGGSLGTTKLLTNSAGWSVSHAGGKAEQKVYLPAGAYSLTAKIYNQEAEARLYATLENGRTQKTHLAQVNESSTKSKHDRELTFVVPQAGYVTVGMEFDEGTPSTNVYVYADNFHLVRTGDAEGAEISTQIVNNAFANGKSDALNVKYGWEKNAPGFLAYNNNAAEVYYNNGGSYNNWANYTIAQEVIGLPDGWYKIEAQGFYRDGELASESQNRGRALLFANDSYTSVKFITDIESNSSLYSDKNAGGYPNTMTQAATAFSNNPSKYMNELTVHVKDGKITLGIKRTDAINKDWLIMNYFKLYYLYEENMFADVSDFIKNPSFETGTYVEWTHGNLSSNEKATNVSGGSSDWDKNFYYSATPNNSQEGTLAQTISGLPSGVYKVSVQVQAVGGSAVKLYGDASDNATTKIAESSSSDVTTISGTVNITDGQDLTIKVGSKGKYNVDNFKLAIISSKVYLYNADAGAFFGKKIESGYEIHDSQTCIEQYGNPVGLSTEGVMLTMTKEDNIVTFRNPAGEILNARRPADNNAKAEYKYTFFEQNKESHNRFMLTPIEGSSYNLNYLSIDPTDMLFGKTIQVENIGVAKTYNGLYGTTYMGWSGEPGFDIALAVIPESDTKDKGIKWQVISQAQYEQYKDKVTAARDARMAAWPILCSAKNSVLTVDYAQFENAYYNISSTSATITELATKVANQLKSEKNRNAATKTNYVDMTFLVSDASCNQKTVGWTNAKGLFKSCEINGQTSNRVFSGRHYEALSDNALENTEFYTELDNLNYGRYAVEFTVSAYADGNSVTGVSAFARNDFGESEVSFGSSVFNIQTVTTDEFTIDGDNPTILVGVKLENTNARFVAIDNIKLYYLGTTNSDVYNYDYSTTNGVLTLRGEWPNDQEAKNKMSSVLNSHSKICTIDLSYNNFSSNFEITIDSVKFSNKNLLVIKKDRNQSNITIKNKNCNIVENGTCKYYLLTDKVDISVPTNFVATKASYSRSMSGTSEYGTLCLPFEYSSNDQIQYYQFSNFEMRNGKYHIGITDLANVAACKPSIFKKLDSSATSITVKAENVTVSKSTAGTVSNSVGFDLVGTFKSIVIGDNTGANATAASDCYYISKDKFWKGTDYFNVGAFRSYIHANSHELGEALARMLSFNLAEVENVIEEETGIEDVEGESTIVGCYDINGAQLATPKKGLNLIKYSDGKVKKIYVK